MLYSTQAACAQLCARRHVCAYVNAPEAPVLSSDPLCTLVGHTSQFRGQRRRVIRHQASFSPVARVEVVLSARLVSVGTVDIRAPLFS